MEFLLKIIVVFSYLLCGVFVGLLFKKFRFSWKRIFLYFFVFYVIYSFQNIYGMILFSFVNLFLFDDDYISSSLLSVLISCFQTIVKIFFLSFDSTYYETIYSTVSFHFDKFLFHIISTSVVALIFFLFRRFIEKILNYSHPYYLLFFLLCINITYILLGQRYFLSYVVSNVVILGICYVFYLQQKFLSMKKDCVLTDRLNLDYRRKVHENRNHLLLIKYMDYKEEINHYVDSLLGEKELNQNHYWVSELSYLHLPGIKDFLTDKLDQLNDMGATIEVFVSDELDNIREMNHNHYKDLSTIMGVLLDNMIDCMRDIDQKLISIHFYIDDNVLHVEFVNNIEREVDIDSIFQKGYSTKGKRRGVGLSIVSDIVKSNEYIECRPKIIDNFFMMDVAYELDTKNH